MLRLPQVGLAVVVGYLTVLTAAALRAAASTDRGAPRDWPERTRFIVLIPAHNEERLIGATLKSLAEADYPPELVAVHVVADNCTDATAAVARSFGAEAHERTDALNPGKGPALQWLLGRLWNRGEPHDAVVIIDADTIVNSRFLRAMDAKLAEGASVVQAYYAVRDPGQSPATAARAAALAARHYLRPLGRTSLGGSCGLFGNGMAFAEPVLRTRAWSSHLTEDVELQLELLVDGTPVAFAPDAVVEAEMPTTLAASKTQHERWERGRIDLARRFLPPLTRRIATGGPAGRVAYADAALDQLVPPFSIVAAGTAAWGGAALVRAVVAPSRSARRDLAVAATLSAAQTVHVFSALWLAGAPASVYRSLLYAPRLVLWKLALWLRVLVRPQGVSWVRTARNAERGAP